VIQEWKNSGNREEEKIAIEIEKGWEKYKPLWQ
jgi:hypothetical protein